MLSGECLVIFNAVVGCRSSRRPLPLFVSLRIFHPPAS
jgi:hypothetical protein